MQRLAALTALVWVVATCCSAANVVTVRQPDADCVPVEEIATAVEAQDSSEEHQPTPAVLLANVIRARPRCPPGSAWIKGRCRRVVRCKPAGSAVATTALQTDRSYWRWFAVTFLRPFNSFAAAQSWRYPPRSR
ncbi:uncharacterized protein LOC126253137 isoform X1 [Schistocerca nitens]|uniref:uncharacterized protein LOC126253137 isoform X1 n=1 Tax=Schistocerca nitens TaxID=7011 RepID=UPI0021180D62|nr:uncharacterized protein LOC126253137 isoform X1 [Schistocerca nitens]